MRAAASPFPFVASGITAIGLVAAIFLFPGFARAGEAKKLVPAAGSCTCPQAGSTSKPKLAALPPPLDTDDEVAVLESVQIALSKVADGSSYVWHRSHGRLSGVVRPTSSFKDAKGQVCRHIVVILNSLETTKKTETAACRQENGIWQLDG